MTPDISYIVSLYNRPELLPCCLWSLKAQTHQSFEVIVTDNTTDDKIAKKQERFVAGLKDKRFYYVRTSDKIKVSDCYWSAEYGKAMAEGRWLAFPCEDCYYPPEFAQRMLGEAVRNNWNLVLCENIICGPETCGSNSYMHMRVGTPLFPGYKPSFFVRREQFKEWINKPVVPACSGVDRTTLRYLTEREDVKWGAVRDLYYVHN